jgi:hypothetical protein
MNLSDKQFKSNFRHRALGAPVFTWGEKHYLKGEKHPQATVADLQSGCSKPINNLLILPKYRRFEKEQNKNKIASL